MHIPVSILLPVYNQESYIAEALESILTQTFSHFELLVLDDGSTDGSAAIIRKYAAKDQRIKAFYTSNNGRAAATNYLLAEAAGKYCAIIDADDRMLPQRLARQWQFLESRPNVAACSCHCFYIDAKGNRLGLLTYHFLRSEADAVKAIAQEQVVICSYTSMMIQTAVFRESGGLNKQFWPADDFEWINRLLRGQHAVVIMQEALMEYRQHASSASATYTEYMHNKRSYAWTCFALRQKGLPDIGFEEFMEQQRQKPYLKRIKTRKRNLSIVIFQQAGFALYRKKYLKFLRLAVQASLLSPGYLIDKLKTIKSL